MENIQYKPSTRWHHENPLKYVLRNFNKKLKLCALYYGKIFNTNPLLDGIMKTL
jgi:hypothetical protein